MWMFLTYYMPTGVGGLGNWGTPPFVPREDPACLLCLPSWYLLFSLTGASDWIVALRFCPLLLFVSVIQGDFLHLSLLTFLSNYLFWLVFLIYRSIFLFSNGSLHLILLFQGNRALFIFYEDVLLYGLSSICIL